jgi:glycosyltransferase involved in cell wall biosynthesis
VNILFITERFPYPLDSGGKIRTYHILKGLSQEHDITLITSIEKEEQRHYIPELENLCQEVNVIKAPSETTLRLGFKLVKNLFSSVPIVVERHYLPGVADTVRRQITSRALSDEPGSSFDVVHFDHLDASIYLSCVPGIKITVLDEHNIVSNQIETTADAEQNLLKRFYMKFQLRKTVRYETEICNKMRRCFVCSDTDKSYLLKMAKDANVITIPNGVDVEYFHDRSWLANAQEEIHQEPNSMIFVGTLDYGPGATAVRYFCEEILPLIQGKIPDMRFFAVGQNPPKYLQVLAEHDNRIIVTGRVDDIRPYVARSNVFVVPLKSGSGTRLKILDAMAMGIPVVSTSIGAEGLDVQSEKNIFLADTPEAFSSAILRLLQDKNLVKVIRDNAFRLVQEKYDWKNVWIDLLAAYRELEQTL